MKFRVTVLAELGHLLSCWSGLRAEQVLAIAKPRLLSTVERFEALPPSGLFNHYRAGIFGTLLEVPEQPIYLW
jgi:hypothetical protein